MTAWSWVWVGWGVYFAIVEGWALAHRNWAGTLSAHVWAFLGLRFGEVKQMLPKKADAWTKVRRVVFISFWVWFLIHAVTGGRYV